MTFYYSGNSFIWYSRDVADELGGFPGEDNQNVGDNSYDAYRHALLSAKLTDHFGSSLAKKIGDDHEEGSEPDPANMDRWNNDVGREGYRKWREAKDAGETEKSLEKWIYDAVKAGKTINSLDDPRKWVDHPPTDELPEDGFDPFTGMPWPGVDPTANTKFKEARNFVIRYDPLVLDLDGDGLELVGATGNILFDHNADGIKTGTGWAKSDDGFLVRDLDGNGSIDTGRELFGVDTIKSNGTLAINGFDALKDLDTNGDGFFTSADAAYGDVKVWRDLNQDGVSQASELQTLASLNLTSIGLNGTNTGPQAGQVINNNAVALSATFTQNGQTHTVGAIDLETNNFFTAFPTQIVDEAGNPVAITTQAWGLPQMNGAGMVRDMRAAASLDGDFAAALTRFAAGTTREAQRGMLDNLVTQWANTSSFEVGLLGTGGVNITYSLPAGMTAVQYANMINVLEKFNGSRFYGDSTGGPRPAGFAIQSATESSTGNVTYHYIISPPAAQVALLQQAFDVLKESVYAALVPQTRLKQYTDQIGLVMDESGIRFDFAAVNAAFTAKGKADTPNAIYDLLDMQKYQGSQMCGLGWSVYNTLGSVIRAAPQTQALQGVLDTERIELVADGVAVATASNLTGGLVLGNALANVMTGNGAVNYLFGGAGNDSLIAVGSGDTLDGGDGDDVLSTSNPYASGTTFMGGQGNDTITASYCGNTYVFNAGDGQDTINDYSPYASYFPDTLKFGAGITASGVTPVRIGEDLVFKLAGGTDQITVNNWFTAGNGSYQIEQVQFADGTVWSSAQVNAVALEVFGTAGADTLTGVNAFADVLHGGAGNDSLIAVGSGDTLDGGDGDDVLSTSSPYASGTTFMGGQGNDTITASYCGNTYVFNAGDGQDTINDYSPYASYFPDTLKFGAGITADQLWFRQTGNDLQVSVMGTTDQITVKDWYASMFNDIEVFEASGGQRLICSDVNSLVQAMAAFSPPAAGETSLPTNYAASLVPVITANWH